MALRLDADYNSIDTRYHNLACAVCEQAVWDYREMLQMVVDNPMPKGKTYYQHYKEVEADRAKLRKAHNKTAMNRTQAAYDKAKVLFNLKTDIEELRSWLYNGGMESLTNVDGVSAVKAIEKQYPDLNIDEFLKKEGKGMKNYSWACHFSDNSGKKQNFKIKAPSKEEAIDKAFARAKKYAKGDLDPSTWTVRLTL